MQNSFTDPEDIRSIFIALRRERGKKYYNLSDEELDKGDALLTEWRRSSPLSDRELGAETILASLSAHPDKVSAIRHAAACAPEDVRGLVLLHGIVQGVARDREEEPSPVRRLF